MGRFENLRDFTEAEAEAWFHDHIDQGQREYDFGPASGGGRRERHEAPPPPPRVRASRYTWTDPAKIPKRAWLYGTTYIRQFLTVTAGPGGFGKSSLVLVEAIAMVTGRALLGIQVAEPLRVWYVNLEDPLEEIERRVAAICLCFDVIPEDIGDRLFLDSGDDCDIVVMTETREGAKVAEPVVAAITSEMEVHSIDVLMLDPFASTHAVSENDNNRINSVAAVFAGIARKTGASVALVHHVRKGVSGQGEYTIDDSRGAKALVDRVRIGRVLNGMTKEEGEQAGVENHRAYFHLTQGKANLAPAIDRRQWFHLKSVSLGNGVVGIFDDSDHVGVVVTWEMPDPQANVTVHHLREVQAAVAAGRYRENAQAKDWVGHAVAKVLGLDPTNRAQKRIILGNVKTWLGTGALVTAEGEDAKRNKRTFVEVGVQATD